MAQRDAEVDSPTAFAALARGTSSADVVRVHRVAGGKYARCHALARSEGGDRLAAPADSNRQKTPVICFSLPCSLFLTVWSGVCWWARGHVLSPVAPNAETSGTSAHHSIPVLRGLPRAHRQREVSVPSDVASKLRV